MADIRKSSRIAAAGGKPGMFTTARMASELIFFFLRCGAPKRSDR